MGRRQPKAGYACRLRRSSMKALVCPVCDREMVKGRVSIRDTVVGVLLIGFSRMKLFFSPDDQSFGSLEIIRPGWRKVSWWCSKCRGVFVSESPWQKPAAQLSVAADRRPVVANLMWDYTSSMSTQPRHAARTREWSALPAGRAPLRAGMAPAAERRSVRRPAQR